MFDEVWRLEKIAKDGASHKRLADHGVSTVKEFLRLYVTKPNYLRHVRYISIIFYGFRFAYLKFYYALSKTVSKSIH